MKNCFLFSLPLSLLALNHALAWGPLGHRMVAETAALLVQQDQPAWGLLFSQNRTVLGSNAILPDSLFRLTDGASSKLEAPTHYFDLDLVEKTAGKNAIQTLPLSTPPSEKVGSSPWRAEQFSKRAQAKWKDGTLDEVFFELGVMSHYTGDAAMPYHAIEDYDGVQTHEKGIHFYFETTCVDDLEPGISSEVLEMAKKNQKSWLSKWKDSLKNKERQTPVGMMLALLKDSESIVPSVSEVDLKKVVTSHGDEALKRKSAIDGCPAFRSILIERLAKGAVLTAELWEKTLPPESKWKDQKKVPFADPLWKSTYPAPDYLRKR